MSIEKPKVSIVIPVFNGANFLAKAVDSALNQTYKNIEIIVIDDGSNDGGNTKSVIEAYGNKIKAIYKVNGGCASALNAGIANMSGEYFSWLSHDDVYISDKIEKQIDLIQKSGDLTKIVYSGYKLIDEEDNEFATVDPIKLYEKNKLELGLYPLLKGLIHGCSLLLHKSHFDEHGLFDLKKLHTQDYSLWFEIFRNKKILCSSEILIKSRAHNNQSSKLLRSDALAEGNQLWSGFLEKLTPQEKILFEGSEKDFNYEMYKMLRTAGYLNAANFAMDSLSQCLEREKINKNMFLLKKKASNDLKQFLNNVVTGKLSIHLIIYLIISRYRLIIKKRINKN